jgi:hypothetical protein
MCCRSTIVDPLRQTVKVLVPKCKISKYHSGRSKSQNTGKFYATSRKCRIPSTFNADVAKLMVGQQIDGDIVRVESDPYEYTNKTTGEIITLAHSYAYRPKGSMELLGESRMEIVEEKKISKPIILGKHIVSH